MCAIMNQRMAYVLCIVLNAVNLNNGATNAWTVMTAEQLSPASRSDRAFSKITKFDEADSFQLSDDIDVSAVDDEQPLLPNKSLKSKIPSKNIINGLFHNYRSSYVGNKTAAKNPNENPADPIVDVENKINDTDFNEDSGLKNRRRKPLSDFDFEIKYNVGPGVNISVEKDKELVSVYLDEDCLRDVFTGMNHGQYLIILVKLYVFEEISLLCN